MNIIRLTEHNLDDFRYFIDVDSAENLGREFYRGLIAEDNNIVKAAIIWHYDFSKKESNIEWFESTEQEASEAIFAAYKEIVHKDKINRSNVVLPATRRKQEKDLLKQLGFNARLTESDDIFVTLAELMEMPIMKDMKIPEGIKPIGELTVKQFKNVINHCVSMNKKGLCEDLETLPFSYFASDISTCFVNEKDEVTGLLLIHSHPSKVYSVQLMICLDKNAGTVIPGLMKLFVKLMNEKCSPDTKILLNRHNETSMLLSEKLLPRGFGIPVYAGSREEN